MKIIFFNHFHRGDLFTSKEFVRQIVNECPDIEFEYWHYNHPKIIRDLNIPSYVIPEGLDRKTRFFDIEPDTIAINTWVGARWDIFEKHGGVNLNTLHESWTNIFEYVNDKFSRKLVLHDKEFYLPTVNYACFNVEPIDAFVAEHKKLALFCNGVPMSNQSFVSDMSDVLNEMALKYPHVNIICTKQFDTDAKNVFFTDDITNTNEEYPVDVPWNDRGNHICDLNEISYLSTKCDLIVGKNSGPFVFCETKDNFMDESKHIISFSNSPRESMSNGMDLKCKYELITDHKDNTIRSAIDKALSEL